MERNVSMNMAARNASPTLSSRRYSAKQTRHQVSFFCDAPQAENVRLVGDFNGWDSAATPMQRTPDGSWRASLELNHGHHRYVFLVDGEPMLDPHATGIARDDQNNRVSLLAVS
jgi:1,4-alpha-glucan branching enzyme